ncbi:kinesin-like protein KIN-14S [Tanacetum coccineum]
MVGQTTACKAVGVIMQIVRPPLDLTPLWWLLGGSGVYVMDKEVVMDLRMYTSLSLVWLSIDKTAFRGFEKVYPKLRIVNPDLINISDIENVKENVTEMLVKLGVRRFSLDDVLELVLLPLELGSSSFPDDAEDEEGFHPADKVRQMKQLMSAMEVAYQSLKKKYHEESEMWKKRCDLECSERRRLHNELIELKGNIRVLCRCRPLNHDEIATSKYVVTVLNSKLNDAWNLHEQLMNMDKFAIANKLLAILAQSLELQWLFRGLSITKSDWSLKASSSSKITKVIVA